MSELYFSEFASAPPDVEALAEVKRELDHGGHALTFGHLDNRTFEVLAWRLKRKEVGADRVRLMQGTGERGRDVVVYDGSRVETVVQCKLLGSRMSKPEVVRELLKVALHDVLDPEVLGDHDVRYELWAPRGLTEPAEDLIRTWPTGWDGKTVGGAFPSVQSAYASFTTLTWDGVRERVLRAFPARLRPVSVGAHDVSTLVRSAPSVHEDFFVVYRAAPLDQVRAAVRDELRGEALRHVADEGVQHLLDQLSGLAAQRQAELIRDLAGWLEPIRRDLESTTRMLGTEVEPRMRANNLLRDEGERPQTGPTSSRRPVLLSRERRRQLGLIATSIVTPTVDRMSRLFPEYDWEAAVDELAGHGLVEIEEGGIVVDGIAYDTVQVVDDVSATVEEDEVEARELLDAWAAAYEAHRQHSDIGYLLGLTYIRLGRLEAGVAAMVDVASGLEPGRDHGVYVSVFDQIAELGGARKLSPEVRARFFNAHGLCLSRLGRYEEALDRFKRLRRLAKRIGDTWAVGQSYLHVGVVYAETGKPRRARAEYEKAVAHGREHGDVTLTSRVLHNLAVLSAHDPAEAHPLLDESLGLKTADEDWMGVVHVHLTRGLVHALAGERSEARRAYAQAARLARRHDLRHLLAISLQESAVAAVEDGQTTDAVVALREANEISEREGYERLECQTRGRLAGALASEGDFGEAAELFERAYEVEQKNGTTEGALEALHNWAVAVLHLGDAPKARQLLGRALRRARELGDVSWVGRVRLVSAFSANGGEPSAAGVRQLYGHARDEARRGEDAVSAWLLDRRSRALVALGAASTEVEEGFRDAEAAHRAVGDTVGLVGLYASWFAWRRDTMGLTPEGIEASAESLRRMQAVAEASGDEVALGAGCGRGGRWPPAPREVCRGRAAPPPVATLVGAGVRRAGQGRLPHEPRRAVPEDGSGGRGLGVLRPGDRGCPRRGGRRRRVDPAPQPSARS